MTRLTMKLCLVIRVVCEIGHLCNMWLLLSILLQPAWHLRTPGQHIVAELDAANIVLPIPAFGGGGISGVLSLLGSVSPDVVHYRKKNSEGDNYVFPLSLFLLSDRAL